MDKECTVQDDSAFGPIVALACRNGFDFTLVFEQSILTLLPSVVYLVVCLPRIRYLWIENAKSLPNHALLWKLVSHSSS
jgi:ATP-binding cassette, subfamily C (CFTR/MRP), member 1